MEADDSLGFFPTNQIRFMKRNFHTDSNFSANLEKFCTFLTFLFLFNNFITVMLFEHQSFSVIFLKSFYVFFL